MPEIFTSSETLILSKVGFLLTPTGLLVNITTHLSLKTAPSFPASMSPLPGLTGFPFSRHSQGRSLRYYDLSVSPCLETATEPGQKHQDSQRKVPLFPRLMEKEMGHIYDKINYHMR